MGGKRKGRLALSAFGFILVLAGGLAAYAWVPTSAAQHSAGSPQTAATAPLLAGAATLPQQPVVLAAAAADKGKAELCLGCHGPFDKLKARTAAYTAPDGVKVNPHLNVPHDSKNVTTCTECHEVHPLPVTGPVKIAKATMQYCYAACHHTNDFTPCVQCHKDMK
jgi:hypothetical protein